MDDLLAAVLDAHGGVRNWQMIATLTAQLSVGGAFWAARGWPDVCAGQTATLDAHREHIVLAPFPAPDRVCVLDVDPERVAIQTANGQVVDQRIDPRATYPTDFDLFTTPWDAIQVAYFAGAALWSYLTAPFVFTYPGVRAWEIEPWDEEGARWRRLAVTFPDSIATHNANQIFYYDKDFMQRRMDYSPDVAGNPLVAHYTHDPRTFDGFVFPTRRLVHLRDEDGVADQSFAAITVDVDTITLQRG